MEQIDKENYLTVSEVAKILGVNKNTILHYDREGVIFSKRDVNNYRYYHKEQIKIFKMILSFRKSGFSLEEIREIKEYIIQQNYSYILELIRQKTQECKKEIEDLKEKLKMLKSHEKYTEYLNDITLENPEKTKVDAKKYNFSEKAEDFFCIKFSEEEQGIYIDIKDRKGNCQNFIESFLEKYNRDMTWLKRHFFGRMMAKEDTLNENYKFNKFIIKANIETCPNKYIFPKEEYAFYYLKTKRKREIAIKEMIEKIKESGYEVKGDLYIENVSIFEEEEEKQNQMRILKIPVKPLTSE